LNINHRGQGLGYSALDKACLFGHEKIVSLLLNSTLHGPSIDYFGNEADWSPLSLATRSGNVNIMKLLLPLMEPEQIDEKFGTKQENILMEACRMGRDGVFDYLMSSNKGNDLNLNLQNAQGNSALILACKKGNVNMLERLLGKSDVTIVDEIGMSALMLSCINGQQDIVNLLLTKDFQTQISICDERGRTALHFASKGGHFEIVKILLSFNADVNIKNLNKQTALMFAAGTHLKVVRVLLAVPGIDVNAKDSEGQSACNYALSSANDEVLEFLCEAGNEDALKFKRKKEAGFCRIS